MTLVSPASGHPEEMRPRTMSMKRTDTVNTVAEHVFACILALAHNLEAYVADVRAGKWQSSQDFCMLTHPVRELSTMTLGIVGFGELGRGVARFAEAFGMDVIVAARPGTEPEDDRRVAFDELLARSDVISLHCRDERAVQ